MQNRFDRDATAGDFVLREEIALPEAPDRLNSREVKQRAMLRKEHGTD